MSRHLIVIAGAGPAGAAVAARLSALGRGDEIVVLDRYHFPRDKPCGGALTGHAGPIMAELGLELRVPHHPCNDCVVRYGSFERRVTMGSPVEVIRRHEYDASLVDQVRERGVEVRLGVAVKSFRDCGEHLEVETSRGETLRCSILIGADGAASVVRKALHGQHPTPHRLFRAEITVPGEVPQMTYDFSLMHRGLRGYLWLFPMPGGLVNVGLMHYPNPEERRSGRELVELLAEGLVDYDIELPERCAKGWPVWGYHPKSVVSAPRVLLVGDAAGIDGLTGEGIAVAMEQAVVAADAAHAALASGDVRFLGYRRALRRAVVGRELALDRWLARLLYGGNRWRDFLSLVLFDSDVLQMYARRVDGTEILADQKARLYRALARHALARRGRVPRLRAHAGDLAGARGVAAD